MLCGKAAKPGGVRAASKLHADHDHATGRHRDLLCLSCNNGIGYFYDNPALLRAAADYIERHRQVLQVSNKRKLRSGRVTSQRCSFCGHAAGGLRALRMRNGQVACPRCQENGGGLAKLACGHYGVAGAVALNENGDGRTFVCAACATARQAEVMMT